MKEKKSFRLEAETIAYLEEYAKANDETLTQALERIVDRVRQLSDKNSELSDTCPTPENPEPIGESVPLSVIEILTDQLTIKDQQLATKDEQIAALNQALLNAQDQGKAAQLLQAAEKAPALLDQPTETPADPPIGEMTFRQLFRTWRKARK